MQVKILIIRFSSFGDIVQCSSILPELKTLFKTSTIHWVTRSDFTELVALNAEVDHIWSFKRSAGLMGLLKLGLALKKEGYTHVYDAHSNLRSVILLLFFSFLFKQPFIIKRSKNRIKRFLLFVLRKNYFAMPYLGRVSYLSPVKAWGGRNTISVHKWNFNDECRHNIHNHLKACSLELNSFVILVPSAAWGMKRWPLENFKKLITLSPDTHFVILGGPDDGFTEELVENVSGRVFNFAGKLSLIESCYMLTLCSAMVSADTGLLHVADILGIEAVALIGPTAFGQPAAKSSRVAQVNLDCRPCSKDGRGKCIQPVYQKCMVDITPTAVKQMLDN